MSKKLKKAISDFTRHLENLETITDQIQGNSWKASLKDSLTLYIGPNSSISDRLDKLYFTRQETRSSNNPNIISVFKTHVYDESKKENFRDLVNNAIEYIKSNGVYQNPNKKNFLSSFNNTEIIGGIVVAIGIVFSSGNYLGKLEKDRDILKFETEAKTSKEKLELSQQESTTLKKNIEDLTKQILILEDSLKIKTTANTK